MTDATQQVVASLVNAMAKLQRDALRERIMDAGDTKGVTQRINAGQPAGFPDLGKLLQEQLLQEQPCHDDETSKP